MNASRLRITSIRHNIQRPIRPPLAAKDERLYDLVMLMAGFDRVEAVMLGGAAVLATIRLGQVGAKEPGHAGFGAILLKQD